MDYTLTQQASDNGCTFEKPADGDVGYDICAAGDTEFLPGQTVKVRTGLHVAIPQGYVGFIKDKSSVGSLGLSVIAGVIDPSYRGEVIVVMYRRPNEKFFDGLAQKFIEFLGIHIGNKLGMVETYRKSLSVAKIPAGSRVAQLVIMPAYTPATRKRTTLGETDRGDGSFGSTGGVVFDEN